MVEMRNILRRWLPKHRKTSDAARSWIWDRNSFVHCAYHQASSSHRDHPIKASKLEKSEAGKRRKKKKARKTREMFTNTALAHSWCFSVNRMLGPGEEKKEEIGAGQKKNVECSCVLIHPKISLLRFRRIAFCVLLSTPFLFFCLASERVSSARRYQKRHCFFLFLVESSNYRVFHAHTYVAGPRAIMLLLRAPRYEGTAMRQSLTKGTPHGTGSVHIAASSWHAALNLIQFYAVWPFFIYEYFSQNRIFDDFQLPAKKTTLVISKPKKKRRKKIIHLIICPATM